MKYFKIRHTLISLACLMFFASCGPVNFLTQTKRTPRRYSVNYNYENVKSEWSELNKKSWVVYSDRQGNATTMRPGGTLPFKVLEYMEPLYVIGRKGDYYKLIKYDPAVLKNERLSKRKDAEFYGWIHKDRLLLFNNSETEVRNGIKLKSLASITDCGVVLEAEKYFNSDSMLLYSTPKLDTVRGSVGLNSVVYVLKTAENGTRVLISQKNTINPDEAMEMTTGWVDASLVAPFGQRLTLRTPPEVMVPGTEQGTLWTARPTVSPVSLSPALYAHRVDTSLVFRTLDASEIIDHSDNRIYNVDGNPITYRQGRQIAADLKNINVIFAFVPTENVAQQMPMLSNAIQNLKPLFDVSLDGFRYSFAGVVGSEMVDFENDYLTFSDRLIEAGKGIAGMEAGSLTAALRGGLTLSGRHPDATNIIVLIGEQAPGWDGVPEDIKRDFIGHNCRLLSYQVWADNEDRYNNFVLQSLDIIEYYAEEYRTLKRSLIVYSDQLRPQNLFLEGAKNAYSLNFPARSMTQGMVIFPEKGRSTEPELLITGVDSLVRQVVADNLTLIGSIDRAFMQVGRHRSRFQSEVTTHLEIDPQTRIAPHVGEAFNEATPQWVGVTDRIAVPVDSVNMSTVGLLLTEAELADVTAWVEQLASMKPDVKGEVTSSKKKARHVRRVRRDLRGVPADVEDNRQSDTTQADADSLVYKYAPTGAIRKNLVKTYLEALSGCVFEGRVRRLTLAEAQEYIATMPTATEELRGITIRDLKRKRRLSNRDLDLLIEYFELCKGLIEEQTIPVKDLTVPDGEKFFFLPFEAMP